MSFYNQKTHPPVRSAATKRFEFERKGSKSRLSKQSNIVESDDNEISGPSSSSFSTKYGKQNRDKHSTHCTTDNSRVGFSDAYSERGSSNHPDILIQKPGDFGYEDNTQTKQSHIVGTPDYIIPVTATKNTLTAKTMYLEKDSSLSSEASPCLSRDSSVDTGAILSQTSDSTVPASGPIQPPYTDSTGIDLENFIKMTLNKNLKDRLILLKIEKDLIAWFNDSKHQFLKFPAMTSYHRMLVHRVAAYFGCEHNVDQTGKCVVVNKTPNSRLPSFSFNDYVEQLADVALAAASSGKDDDQSDSRLNRNIFGKKLSTTRRDFASFEESRNHGTLSVNNLEANFASNRSKSFEENRGLERLQVPNHGMTGSLHFAAPLQQASFLTPGVASQGAQVIAIGSSGQHSVSNELLASNSSASSLESGRLVHALPTIPAAAPIHAVMVAPNGAAVPILRPWSSIDSSGYSTDSSFQTGGSANLLAGNRISMQKANSVCGPGDAPSTVMMDAGDTSGFVSKTESVASFDSSSLGSPVSRNLGMAYAASNYSDLISGASSSEALSCTSPSDSGSAAAPVNNGNDALPFSTSQQVFFVVSNVDSIPTGSIIINPETGQPYLNKDGSIYRHNPALVSRSSNSNNNINSNNNNNNNRMPSLSVQINEMPSEKKVQSAINIEGSSVLTAVTMSQTSSSESNEIQNSLNTQTQLSSTCAVSAMATTHASAVVVTSSMAACEGLSSLPESGEINDESTISSQPISTATTISESVAIDGQVFYGTAAHQLLSLIHQNQISIQSQNNNNNNIDSSQIHPSYFLHSPNLADVTAPITNSSIAAQQQTNLENGSNHVAAPPGNQNYSTGHHPAAFTSIAAIKETPNSQQQLATIKSQCITNTPQQFSLVNQQHNIINQQQQPYSLYPGQQVIWQHVSPRFPSYPSLQAVTGRTTLIPTVAMPLDSRRMPQVVGGATAFVINTENNATSNGINNVFPSQQISNNDSPYGSNISQQLGGVYCGNNSTAHHLLRQQTFPTTVQQHQRSSHGSSSTPTDDMTKLDISSSSSLPTASKQQPTTDAQNCTQSSQQISVSNITSQSSSSSAAAANTLSQSSSNDQRSREEAAFVNILSPTAKGQFALEIMENKAYPNSLKLRGLPLSEAYCILEPIRALGCSILYSQSSQGVDNPNKVKLIDKSDESGSNDNKDIYLADDSVMLAMFSDYAAAQNALRQTNLPFTLKPYVPKNVNSAETMDFIDKKV